MMKEDYLTYLDKRVRDWLFKPITTIFGFIPCAANILTIFGFLTLILAIIDFLYFKNNIERQIWFLIIAWLTDLIDGPTARNNNNVTAFGTIADRSRDFFIVLWTMFLGFYVTISLKYVFHLSYMTSGTISLIMSMVLAVTTIGTIMIPIGSRIYLIKKRRERPDQPYFEFISEFLLNDMVTNFIARFHGFVVAFGMIFYLAGAIWGNFLYFQIGAALLIIQLVIFIFYLCDIFRLSYKK